MLTEQEVAGLNLFIGRGKCLDCHNGPLFTDNDLHNVGVLGRRWRYPPNMEFGIRSAICGNAMISSKAVIMARRKGRTPR